MLTRLAKALLAALLLALPTQLPAQDRDQPTLRAAYGPMTLCLGDYAIDIRADEAGLLSSRSPTADPDAVSILGSHGTIRAALHGPWGQADTPARTRTLRLPSGIVVTRRDVRAHSGYRAGIPGEMVYGTTPAYLQYRLPIAGSEFTIDVAGEVFDRRSDSTDRAWLARFRARAGAACATPPVADADNPAWQRAPQRWNGPLTLCRDGLALTLTDGESVQFDWPVDQSVNGPPAWHVRMARGEAHIVGGAPRWGRRPNGPLLSAGWTLTQSEGGSTMVLPDAVVQQRYPGAMTLHVGHHGVPHGDVANLLRRMSFVSNPRHCTI